MKHVALSHPTCRMSLDSDQAKMLVAWLLVCFAITGTSRGQDRPLDPQEAAKTAIMPEEFSVTVFAAEPDVQQPIAFCIDDRGRLWVAEAYNYPNHGTRPGDRILIFEDADGDGRFDKRTVFYDKLNYVTGIEVGFGGAWVMSPPYFYFIPDRNGDDRPDGEPQVLLDGFGNHANAHNLANGFSWGPDGWLYGTHGRTNWSMLGKPGTPDDQRVQFDGGVYRYHPMRHEWESFADGTTNPWDVDFDDYGQAFISNIGPRHLYHAIQGAHYEPWRNRKSSQYAYQRIPTIADHHHWPDVLRRGTRDSDPLTGEDHAGVLIYLGDNWPDHYRNTVLMCNLHGRRINNDLLARKGSGYTASHGPDTVSFKDPWFVGVTLRCGPDGAVYVSDWSETGECHFRTNTHRATGRIYKITYDNVGQTANTANPSEKNDGLAIHPAVNITKLGDQELVRLQLHKNDWYVRHARRVLQERTATGRDMSAVHRSLLDIFNSNPDVTRTLRAMWALHVTGGAHAMFLRSQLDHESEYVRAWAIRLLCERKIVSAATIDNLARVAKEDRSAFVRLHLASALLRLPFKARWPIAEELVLHAEDAEDPNLPLMYWYGIEPLVPVNTPRSLQLLRNAKIPIIRQFIARRAASGDGLLSRLDQLVQFLSEANDLHIQLDMLDAIREALRGRRDLEPPDEWPKLYAKLAKSNSPRLRWRSLRLGLLLGDTKAMDTMRRLIMDPEASIADRREGLQDLVEQKDLDLPLLLHKLIDQPAMRAATLRGLAAYDHPNTPRIVLEHYASFTIAEKQDAVVTLTSRPAYAFALLEAIEKSQVTRGNVSAATVRHLQKMNSQPVNEKLVSLWGVIRPESRDKAALTARRKRMLSREFLAGADLPSGRAIYSRTCAACHTLFGDGAKIGPDITGSNRANLDYILENILEPSALVEKAYQLTIVQTEDGRIISGLLAEQSDDTVTIQTQNERIILPTGDIDTMKRTPVSMMPEGLLKELKDAEVRDLIAYLASPIQVPLPKGYNAMGDE
ncbi:MAG TPA: PVC-type heme-binding CxxCH protein [Pirellulaceae bacterium]|nr:PVC-type heme-binding CxxCH protein [Pirellulaceae bacterium]